jgi:hypothetical protein
VACEADKSALGSNSRINETEVARKHFLMTSAR